MPINPQRVIRLAVLIEHGSFGRAAAHLGLTQPALSQSIAQFEREVGVKLIERTSRGIQPTVYGRMLCEHAKSIDRELARAAQDIEELAFGHKNRLNVGTSTGGAASVVATAVCKLHLTRSGTDTNIVEEASTKELLIKLRERIVDVVICPQPNERELKGTLSCPLLRAKRIACIRAGHPLKGKVTLKSLSSLPFVCPPEEMGLIFGLPQIFSTMGIHVSRVLMSNSIYMSKEIVLNSDAFALFSDISVINETRLGLLKWVELGLSTHYWVQLIVRAEQAPTDLIKSFVTALVAVCKDLSIETSPDALRLPSFRRPVPSGRRRLPT